MSTAHLSILGVLLRLVEVKNGPAEAIFIQSKNGVMYNLDAILEDSMFMIDGFGVCQTDPYPGILTHTLKISSIILRR